MRSRASFLARLAAFFSLGVNAAFFLVSLLLLCSLLPMTFAPVIDQVDFVPSAAVPPGKVYAIYHRAQSCCSDFTAAKVFSSSRS